VTFTATVSEAGGTPGGTVTFNDGSSQLVQVALVNGVASFTSSSLTQGSHSISAVYGGSATESSSTSSVLDQEVALAPSQTVLASSANPSKLGEAITLAATVTSAGFTPSGDVTFSDGGTSLGTSSLSGGVATLTVSGLTAGTHLLTATYAGSQAVVGSTSNQLVQDVSGGSTTTTLKSSVNPAAKGTRLTFTAAVASSDGTPAGAVDFYDGTKLLGSSLLSKGIASLSNDSLSAGTHAITAMYMGGGDYTTSKSTTLEEVVTSEKNIHRIIHDCVDASDLGYPRWVERFYCYAEVLGRDSIPVHLVDRFEKWMDRHHHVPTPKPYEGRDR
jgi:hypothetical protein